MRWTGHVARIGDGRKVYKVLVGKPEGKRPLGKPRRIWEDWIRMDRRETGWGVWSGSSWLRIGPLARTCKYGDESSGSGATDLVRRLVSSFITFISKPSDVYTISCTRYFVHSD
jgi:hypothetical protein